MGVLYMILSRLFVVLIHFFFFFHMILNKALACCVAIFSSFSPVPLQQFKPIKSFTKRVCRWITGLCGHRQRAVGAVNLRTCIGAWACAAEPRAAAASATALLFPGGAGRRSAGRDTQAHQLLRGTLMLLL